MINDDKNNTKTPIIRPSDGGGALASGQPKSILRPPANARCNRCGSDRLSCLPTFSAGSGVGYRPVADDVFCQRCGFIGPLAP